MNKKNTGIQVILLTVVGIALAYLTAKPNYGRSPVVITPQPEKSEPIIESNPVTPASNNVSNKLDTTNELTPPDKYPSESLSPVLNEPQKILGQKLHTREIRLIEENGPPDGFVRDIEFVFRPGILPKRLFQHTRFIILKYDQLYQNDVGKGARTVRFYFESVTEDSNGDGTLSTLDKREVGVSYPDGSKYRKLISGVDKVMAYEYLEVENALKLTIQVNNQLTTHTFPL